MGSILLKFCKSFYDINIYSICLCLYAHIRAFIDSIFLFYILNIQSYLRAFPGLDSAIDYVYNYALNNILKGRGLKV